MKKSLLIYHTQEFRYPIIKFPVLAEGNEQWLGEGYYFWQDLEFAKWWGKKKKSKGPQKKYSIFDVTIEFEEDDFIDTVFNEQDYYNFVKTVEKFAGEYYLNFNNKPTLEEFNDFIQDHSVWENIKVIRFQDIAEDRQLLKVHGYYYKKRIQIRVNDSSIISNFVPH